MTNGRLFARTRLAFPLHQSHAMPHFYSPFWEAMPRLAVNR